MISFSLFGFDLSWKPEFLNGFWFLKFTSYGFYGDITSRSLLEIYYEEGVWHLDILWFNIINPN